MQWRSCRDVEHISASDTQVTCPPPLASLLALSRTEDWTQKSIIQAPELIVAFTLDNTLSIVNQYQSFAGIL